MNLNLMKYKNFVWPHNPSTIDISVVRDLKEVNIPFVGTRFQDFGRKKRIVSGQGQFFGENCMAQFESLFLVFRQGGVGYLSLPGMNSFLAAFKELKLTESSMPNILSYSFEFWEDLSSATANLDVQSNYYTASDGDTMWSIAANFEVSIDTLIALNPSIKNPNQLTVGEKVRLR